MQENDLVKVEKLSVNKGGGDRSMGESVSLKDIAKVCNVSVSTVSKAMNDRADVSSAKKEEIRRIAREMNYVPNYMASALKNQYTRNIGVILAEEAGQGLTHEHFAKILNSFKDTVEERGYVITFLNTSNSPSRFSYMKQCQYMKYDGVLVVCADFHQKELDELLSSNIPMVVIDHTLKKHVNIASNQYGDMRRLLQFVFDRGHRKIAYIHGKNSEVTRGRLSAYLDFMKEHHLPVPKEYVYTCPYRDVERADALTKAVLALPDRPTCILYPDDLTAASGLGVLQEMRVRVPEDISIAGYDGICIAGIVRPRLTTIRQDTVSIGIQAGNKLINRIEFPGIGIDGETVTVDSMVEPGESVGVVRK